jgi:uncharacterized protein with HEPN domain
MSEKRRDYRLYLHDIIEHARRIMRYTHGKTYDQFAQDDMLIDAVIRNLEVIGEAVKQIPYSVRRKYPHLEWRKIAGLRDILIHNYTNVSLPILWDIITNKLSELIEQMSAILEAES